MGGCCGTRYKEGVRRDDLGLLVNSRALLPAEVKKNHVNKLLALESAMHRELACYDGTLEHTFHHHCEGVYVREYRIPKGHVVTGKIHRYACINILLKGKIQVSQSDGVTIVEQGAIYISQPGEKKALYAIEDSIMLTTHATHETDQEKLIAEFTVTSDEFLLEKK